MKLNLSKNILYSSIFNISNLLYPLILLPFISRKLGIERTGYVMFFDNLTKYLILLTSLGIQVYGIRSIASCKDENERNATFNSILKIHFLSSIFFTSIFIFLNHFSRIINYNFENELLVIFNIFFSIFTLEWLFNGLGEFKFVALRSLLIRALTLFAIFFAIKSQTNAQLYLIIILISNIITSTFNIYFLKINKFNLNVFKIFKSNSKKHFRPILILFVSNLCITIYSMSDIFILKYYTDFEVVGQYSIAIKISKIFAAIISAIILVLTPKIIKYYIENELDKLRILLKCAYYFLIAITIPIAILTFFLSDEIVYIFSGKNDLVTSNSLKMFSPLVFFLTIGNFQMFQILNSIKKDFQQTLVVIVGVVLSIFLTTILSKKFGIYGCVFSVVFSQIYITVHSLYYCYKTFNINFITKIILQNLFFSAPYILIVILIKSNFNSDIFVLLLSILISFLYFIISQFILLKTNKYLVDFKFILNDK